MILRRITQHVKDQNWFAVGLDFCIVVFGVFFGIQIGNWNDTRLDREAYQQAHERMVIEARNNIHTSEALLKKVSPFIQKVQYAIEDIRVCRNDAQASARIEEAVEILNLTLGPSIQHIAISQLTTSERLLETQTGERREQYARYAQYLIQMVKFSKTMYEKMELRADILHPFIDYGPLRTNDKIYLGSAPRSYILVVEIGEACKDDAFRKAFYRWEAGHDFQINLLNEVILKTKAYLQELGEEITSETPL
jgi:hypothetical protein